MKSVGQFSRTGSAGGHKGAAAAVTGKHTRYAMESYFLVPKRRIQGLVPEGADSFTRFGLCELAVGAWNHAEAYVDGHSYGPVLEAWVAVI